MLRYATEDYYKNKIARLEKQIELLQEKLDKLSTDKPKKREKK